MKIRVQILKDNDKHFRDIGIAKSKEQLSELTKISRAEVMAGQYGKPTTIMVRLIRL